MLSLHFSDSDSDIEVEFYSADEESGDDSPEFQSVSTKKPGRIRRNAVPERPNKPLNLWKLVKNCVGKDLTRVPVPVSIFFL